MHKYILTISLLLLTCGCQNIHNVPEEDYSAIIKLVIVLENERSPSVPTPGTGKHRRSECPECKGTGKLRSGDGILVYDCNYCEPDSSANVCVCGPDCPCDKDNCKCEYPNQCVTKQHQCCPHCTCGPNCNCSYPGECLVAANNGWPVTICNPDGTCAVYYPRDSKGNPYNPFDMIRKDPVKYKKYLHMLPENKNKKVSSSSVRYGSCASCR